MGEYIADFETLACDKEKTHVWAWGVMNQKNKKKEYGSSIAQFINWCKKKSNDESTIVWFHNLRFDGIFIMDYIERELNMRYSEKSKTATYTALIDGMGNFYSIEITFHKYKSKKKSITLYDSAKRIPNMSVKDMAKKYELPIKKGTIDYMLYRSETHVMTPEEKDYLDNDLEIVGAVLDIQTKMGLTKMTIGSSALAIYTQMIGEKKFKLWFKEVNEEIDNFIRLSYNGGFTYVNKLIKGKEIGEGIVFDVNSLYPWVMSCCPLPYGMPVWFDGRYPNEKGYPLYVQKLKCRFRLKKNHIPTIQLDNQFTLRRMKEPEFAERSRGDGEILTLTSVDLEMFFTHYDVHMASIEWLGGYMFKSSTSMFKEYVDHFTKVKIKASNEGNKGMYQTSKLLLNSLYGKFGSKMYRTNSIPSLFQDHISYNEKVETVKPPIYTAIASFVTAYGREVTIMASQKNFDRHLYSDTDSIHLSGSDYPDNILIHKADLGRWKDEGTFQRAKYVRQKAYFHEGFFKKEIKIVKGRKYLVHFKKKKIACSGMGDEIRKKVTFDNFYAGKKFDGQLKKKIVIGGVVLVDRPFTI
jgi:Podoviridae DNA polymerase